MTQYHNLDESGDPSLIYVPGSSRHLVLAMVQLPDNAPLPQLAQVRQNFRLARTFEFKYHTSNRRQRDGFFQGIKSLDFRVRAVVVEKERLNESFRRMNSQGVMIEFITELALRAPPLDLASDVLIVDGATPQFCRGLRVRLSQECRMKQRVRPFSKIVGGRSTYEDGLQLADMIAGALRHDAMGSANEYFQSFQGKIGDLWFAP